MRLEIRHWHTLGGGEEERAGRGDKDKDKEDNKDKEDMEGRDLPADLKEESDDVVEVDLLLIEAEKDLTEILYAEGRLLSDLEN